MFLDFFETSFVVKLYFYNRCTGGMTAFHGGRLELVMFTSMSYTYLPTNQFIFPFIGKAYDKTYDKA